MGKKILILIILFGSICSMSAQDMTKQQTLDYILRIYRKVNKFYLTEFNSMNIPVGIDSAQLEFDQLIFYYNVPGKNDAYSGPRSATISGNLTLDESENGIKNADGDWVLRVRQENTAELKRLFYALQQLQDFVERDPFSGKVNQYDNQKKQDQAEAERRNEEQRRRQAEEERQQLARYRAEQRREADRQRQQEEAEKRERERRGQEALRQLQEKTREATGGGGK